MSYPEVLYIESRVKVVSHLMQTNVSEFNIGACSMLESPFTTYIKAAPLQKCFLIPFMKLYKKEPVKYIILQL